MRKDIDMPWQIRLKADAMVSKNTMAAFFAAHDEGVSVPAFLAVNAKDDLPSSQTIVLMGDADKASKGLFAARKLAAWLRDDHKINVQLETADFSARTIEGINALLRMGK